MAADDGGGSAGQGDPSPEDKKPEVPLDLVSQLRGALERLTAVTMSVPGIAAAQAAAFTPALGLPSLPTPGGLTASQIAAIAGTVRAQRSSIAALRTSLDAFDQQLDVLEQLLGPLESIASTWATLEGHVTGGKG